MTPRIHHIGIGTRDHRRAAAYWRDAVGATVLGVQETGSDDVARADATVLRTSNVYLELVHVDADAPARSPGERSVADPGFNHLCVQADIATPTRERLIEAGTRFPTEMVELPTTIHYAYGRDPGGNVVELELWREARRDPVTWPAHVGVATPDIDHALTFWSGVFGHGPVARADYRDLPGLDAITGFEGVDIGWSMFDLGAFKLEVAQYRQPRTGRRPPGGLTDLGYNHVGLEVADVAGEAERLTALGATFTDAEGPRGERYGWDPDGNVIELLPPQPDVPWTDLAHVLPDEPA